jgi:alginate O-acetyltransferase complex protein AlgI
VRGADEIEPMVFSSPTFICLFVPLTLAFYFVLPRSSNNLVLVAASIVFYGWGDPVAAFALILPSIAMNFHLGRMLGRAEGAGRRRILVISVGINLAILIAFKYSAFIIGNINDVLMLVGAPRLRVPDLPLPLGISFFTFHILSYLIDVYRGAIPPQSSLPAFALYIINFPQLIAGPIIRYRQIADQLAERATTLGDFEYGVLRFVTGLAKKLLIADAIGQIDDVAFGVAPAELTTGAAWLGVICYALQIYFDFSGYSDMAIGLGRMFGFRFPENFNYPYSAMSIQDFWRRWHITLSAWFRDYVYIPLGGNRLGSWKTVHNLWIVFFLTGAWHGASWNFVIWGLWHGLFLSLERTAPAAAVLERMPRILRTGYVLLVVLIGWVFFRASNLDHASSYLARMFAFAFEGQGLLGASDLVTVHSLAMVAVAFLFSLPLWPALRSHLTDATVGRAMRTASAAYVALVMILSLAAMAGGENSPFLYFRF